MAILIEKPTSVEAASTPPKCIEEFIGRVTSPAGRVLAVASVTVLVGAILMTVLFLQSGNNT